MFLICFSQWHWAQSNLQISFNNSSTVIQCDLVSVHFSARPALNEMWVFWLLHSFTFTSILRRWQFSGEAVGGLCAFLFFALHNLCVVCHLIVAVILCSLSCLYICSSSEKPFEGMIAETCSTQKHKCSLNMEQCHSFLLSLSLKFPNSAKSFAFSPEN